MKSSFCILIAQTILSVGVVGGLMAFFVFVQEDILYFDLENQHQSPAHDQLMFYVCIWIILPWMKLLMVVSSILWWGGVHKIAKRTSVWKIGFTVLYLGCMTAFVSYIYVSVLVPQDLRLKEGFQEIEFRTSMLVVDDAPAPVQAHCMKSCSWISPQLMDPFDNEGNQYIGDAGAFRELVKLNETSDTNVVSGGNTLLSSRDRYDLGKLISKVIGTFVQLMREQHEIFKDDSKGAGFQHRDSFGLSYNTRDDMSDCWSKMTEFLL